MIQQSAENGNTQIELNTGFIAAIREMQISKLLHETNMPSYLFTEEFGCVTRFDIPSFELRIQLPDMTKQIEV